MIQTGAGSNQWTISREQAIELTAIATRQYAKRQLTWFRQENNINWLNGFEVRQTCWTWPVGWFDTPLK